MTPGMKAALELVQVEMAHFEEAQRDLEKAKAELAKFAPRKVGDVFKIEKPGIFSSCFEGRYLKVEEVWAHQNFFSKGWQFAYHGFLVKKDGEAGRRRAVVSVPIDLVNN